MQSFAQNIWIMDGPYITGAAGFCFPTRAVIVRLPDGGLWVWSPVDLTPEAAAELDALGPVRHLVAPNTLHYSFVAQWAEHYPEAVIYAVAGLPSAKLGGRVDRILDERAAQHWGNDIDLVLIEGNKITTEAVFFHKPSATVIVTDWIQHMPRGFYRGWRAVVARLDLMTAKVPSVPRKFRVATANRKAARGAVGRILDWPSERLIFAHGTPVAQGAQARLKTAFGWLLGRE